MVVRFVGVLVRLWVWVGRLLWSFGLGWEEVLQVVEVSTYRVNRGLVPL